jgi:hypothetical protein
VNRSVSNHSYKMMNEELEILLSFFPMYLICKEMKNVDIHLNKKRDNHNDPEMNLMEVV